MRGEDEVDGAGEVGGVLLEEDRPAAGGERGEDVGGLVADHIGALQVDAEPPTGLEEETGAGLATVAAGVRVVRADEVLGDLTTRRRMIASRPPWIALSSSMVIRPRPTADWLVTTATRYPAAQRRAIASADPGSTSTSSHDVT